MSEQMICLQDSEALRLNKLLSNKVVITNDGQEGRVIRVATSDIEVQLLTRHRIHPYPLYDSFVTGILRFEKSVYQDEILYSLYEAAKSAGATTSSEVEWFSGESSSLHVSNIDVSSNVHLICFFKDINVERYLFHMRRVGLRGFEESLEEGFKQDPFIALRETNYYLECSTRLLLSSFEEFLCKVFESCSASRSWSWSEPKSKALNDGSPHLSVRCNNTDERRSFIVHATYNDKDLHHCSIIQVDFTKMGSNRFDLHTIQFNVPEPKQETVDALYAIFISAGGTATCKSTTLLTSATSNMPKTIFSKDAGLETEIYGKSLFGVAEHKDPAVPVRVNEFLVRRSYGAHRRDGHCLKPIRATVTILPKSGSKPYPVGFNAYWCPKCEKYFMDEEDFKNLKRKGYICCKVIEEKDLGTKKAGEGIYGDFASESILHMYGYNVNQQSDLSEFERQTIISFVIENKIQTAQDIAHLLEWLISRNEANPRFSVAVSRWRDDLKFVKQYHKPTRIVQVDQIYAKV